jgi:predicted DsbA family dithiol-disulfide isomerase
MLTGFFLTVFLVSGVLVVRRNFVHLGELPQAYASEPKVKGPADAPIEIQEYSDFQCPACQRAQPVLKALLEKYPGKIRVVFHHFPLAGHQWSSIAHQAAECAAVQGKFWEYHDLLFQEQAVWSGPQNPTQLFLKDAQILSLDVDAFATCLADTGIQEKIKQERQGGDRLQVRSTPTFFINKERAVGHLELKTKAEEIIHRTLKLPAEKAQEPEAAPASAPEAAPASAPEAAPASVPVAMPTPTPSTPAPAAS